jgi:UDP-N-acetylglucosamine diphosphorylase/glucosamine-1-phosphate N-acetyltransferase
MQICIFEDEQYLNFEPLVYSRPVYDLVCGINTLREKIVRAFPGEKVVLKCRPYLEPLIKEEKNKVRVNEFEDDDCLFINGRIVAPAKLKKLLSFRSKGDKVYISNGEIIAAKVAKNQFKKLSLDKTDIIDTKVFNSLPSEAVEIPFVKYIWELIYLNGKEIRNDLDFHTAKRGGKLSVIKRNHRGISLVNSKAIFINSEVEIKPGVVLDASTGPIYIDKNATIFSNAVIQGPVYIGEASQIKAGATVYPNVSIAKVCKIGGEVEDSIILQFTNKQHSGFLGHSYLGSWVNIGADTNCSDLQNNYGSIKVQVNGRHVDSGKQFVGLMMGDHSKTAINTMFNTGTVVGFSCNVYGAGFPPKYIPSFSWGGSESMREYKFSKALETAKAVFNRRTREFTNRDEELFKEIFNSTKEDRIKRGF